jgi:1-phosphatidylinositol-3-phosphate 5-kinase
MESPNAVVVPLNGQSSKSRSSSDDVTSLTSFNPFSEEDENDQSSYTIVTSIFSRMKSTLSAPLSSAVGTTSITQSSANITNPSIGSSEARRPSYTSAPSGSNWSNSTSRTIVSERPNPLIAAPPQRAPPLVSLTPAHSEIPTYSTEYDRPVAQRSPYSPVTDFGDTMLFGSIPGFPIQDDARSIKTSTSIHRSGSVSKVMRRLRGEGKKMPVKFFKAI